MVKTKFGELSDDERVSLIKAAKAALRKAGTPCIVFSCRGRQFHYGPMEWEQDGCPPGTYFGRPRELETWRQDTRHQAPVLSLKE